VRIIRWDEVRNAISSELSSPDSEESLVEVFRLLLELPPVELVLLLTSEEILSSLKLLSILPNEFIKLRLCSVRYIADILLRVWLHLEVDIHLEGIRQYESLAESKRAKEDTQDLIKEFFKGFALGVVGKSIVAEKEGKPTEPLIDIQAMTSACSYAVSTVLRSYNSRIAAIAPYVRASVGLASNINKHPLQREEASCLLPLVQHFLPTLLEDFSLLVSRNGNFSSSRELSKLVYNLVLLVVKNMPYRGSSLIPIDPLKSSSSFLFGPVQSQNSTADSRIDPSFNTVLSMTEEWIRFSILDPNEFVNLHGLDFVETSFVLVEILSDDRLEHMRGLVLFPLLDGILATLERTVPDCSLFIELIALGIYCIHMVPHSDINSDVASSEETKLDIHCTVDDNTIADYLSSFLEYASRLDINLDVVRTRICALLAAETFWTHSRISHVTVRSLLSSAAVKTILVKSMPENTIKQRLCTALCRVVNKEIRKIFSDSLDSSTGFEAILLCSVEIFKTFQRCLHWPTNGMQGDSCQLEFIEMARLLAHSFTFPANSSLYTTIYHEFLSSLDEVYDFC
jgi:hypothetical protein